MHVEEQIFLYQNTYSFHLYSRSYNLFTYSTDSLRYVSLPGGNITFHQARSICLARNGDLPKPKTQALWTALLVSNDVASRQLHFYIGIQRDDKGRWRWLGENGEASFTRWKSIPDKGYDCVGYAKGQAYWFQTQCDNNTFNYKYVTVCEIGGEMLDLLFQNFKKRKK